MNITSEIEIPADGIEHTVEWQRGKALAEVYVAKDQTLTEGDIRRAHEIATRMCRRRQHEMKWCEGCGDGMCPCTEGGDLTRGLCDHCGDVK